MPYFLMYQMTLITNMVTESFVIQMLLGIVSFVGVLMVKQLMKIADAVNGIQKDLQVLTNDHTNLKEDVEEIKERVKSLERA